MMRRDVFRYALRASVVAVEGALLALAMAPAHAEDEEVAALTRPTNSVEIGATYTNIKNNDNRGSGATANSNGDNTSYKFGEFNGLQKKGATAVGNIELNGGGDYDSGNATRIRLKGTDLGLDTRNLSLDYSDQGNFRLNLGYDELVRNKADTFQTPYRNVGTKHLTLPSNWMVPILPQATGTALLQTNLRALDPAGLAGEAFVYNAAGAQVAPSAANLQAMTNMRAADLPAFHSENIGTKRSKFDAGFMFNFNLQWKMEATVAHEKKDGTQIQDVLTRMANTYNPARVSDFAAAIPLMINQEHDQYNLKFSYKDEKAYAQIGYYLSHFKNNVSSMGWDMWTTGSTTNAGTGAVVAAPISSTFMSTAPSNQFHQLNFTGGYKFDKNTKLVANVSYGRNTQNDSFLTNNGNAYTNATIGTLPASSLNGLVISKALNLKLTAKPIKDLSLAGAYKFDERDNRTPVNTYQFSDAGEIPAGYARFPGTVAQNVNANRPYSKKVNQLNLDADYSVVQGQNIAAGYEFQKVDRWCNGTWIDCVDAATTKENTLRLEYRGTLAESLTGKAGYEISRRKVDNYNLNAWLALVPLANVVPTGAPAGVTMSAYQAMQAFGLSAYGPVAGWAAATGNANYDYYFPSNNIVGNALYGNNNRIIELLGMRRFNMANRNRDKLRTALNWNATEEFSFCAGFDYSNDKYNESQFGLKNGKATALNLDGTYAANENLTASVFYNYEDKRSVQAGDGGINAANSNTAVGANGVSNQIVGGCYSTLQQVNNNAKIDPCRQWSIEQRDVVNTLGLDVKQKGLVSGKLDLEGTITYSQARTNINALSGGAYVANPLDVAGSAATIAQYYIPATSLPTVKTNTIEFKINGKYTLDKQSAVRLGYAYNYMKAQDYAYDGMQYGTLTAIMPTSEQAPAYRVHSIAAAYIYSFK